MSRLLTACVRFSKKRRRKSAPIFTIGGLILTGGCASLRGLPVLLSQITGVRVTVADKPLQTVTVGLGRFVEHPEHFPYLMQYRAK